MTSKVSQGNGSTYPAGNSLQVDFASILSQLIEALEDDPARMRSVVYETARVQLRRARLLSDPPMSSTEDRRLVLALETAIERVETQALQRDELRAAQARNQLVTDQSQPQRNLQSRASPSALPCQRRSRSSPLSL